MREDSTQEDRCLEWNIKGRRAEGLIRICGMRHYPGNTHYLSSYLLRCLYRFTVPLPPLMFCAALDLCAINVGIYESDTGGELPLLMGAYLIPDGFAVSSSSVTYNTLAMHIVQLSSTDPALT